MDKLTLNFERAVIDSQDYGSDDEFMVSRVFFSIDKGGKKTTGLHVDVKQTVGSNFESSPLEIGRPIGFSDSLKYDEFREAVEKYFRQLIGTQGRVIKVQGPAKIRIQNSTFMMSAKFEISGEKESPAW